MPSLQRSIILVSSLLLAQSALSSASCDCYVTPDGDGNQTYLNYAFYDFRSLGQNAISTRPQLPQNADFDNDPKALLTSPYFNSSDFVHNFYVENFTKPESPGFPVAEVNTALAVLIDEDNSTQTSGATVLSMVSTRMPTYQASAQIQTTVSNMTHASIRLQARLLGPPGVCAGFFIYGDDDNESDVELLTNDTSSIFHATNHPSLTPNNSVIAGASSVVSIPQNGTAVGATNGSWSDWNDWRIDWLDDVTEWYVNGDLVVSKTYSVPKIPAFLGINLWSQGGTWTGNMTVGDSATLQIRFIEMAYNQTSDSSSKTCSNICLVKDNNGGSNGLPTSWAPPKPQGLGAFLWFSLAVSALWSLL